eukprot:2975698-Amphidinium_carterae.2
MFDPIRSHCCLGKTDYDYDSEIEEHERITGERRGHRYEDSCDESLWMCRWVRTQTVYGYRWVGALVGKTQQLLQIRFTVQYVLDVLRPIIALSCLRWMGLELWWSSSGSHSNAQTYSEKAWATSTKSTTHCGSSDATCTRACDLQL